MSPRGNIDVDYAVSGLPDGYLRESGVAFALPDSYRTLSWERNGYWDSYPSEAMSGNAGTVSLYNPSVPPYGSLPGQDWARDTHDYYYWSDRGAVCDRPLTMAAKAMKENIYWYSLSQGRGGPSLSVVSADAEIACRLCRTRTEP